MPYRRHTSKYLVQHRQSLLRDRDLDSRAKRGRLNVKPQLCRTLTWTVATRSTEPINPSTKMSFSDSGYEQHSSHEQPVEPQPQIQTRQVWPLEQLEYCVQGPLTEDNPAHNPGTGHRINLYMIYHRDQTDPNEYIAALAACPAEGLLYG